jgi:hypothetical protein
MARQATVGGHAIPGIVLFFIWIVVVMLIIFVAGLIVHSAGGAMMSLRLGHFVLNVGFS